MQRHRFSSASSRLTITLLLIALALVLPLIPTWTTPAALSQQQPDVALVAPVTWGQTLTISHGFDDHPANGCHAGIPPDHCDQQRWGLDFVPSNPGDLRILAPLPGSIWWKNEAQECLGIKTEDNLNLTICHFASIDVSVNQVIKRGMVLGTRISTKQWVHLSLDTGFGVPSRDPVPFTGAHTIEGRSFETSQNPVGITIMSHNFVPDNEVVFFEDTYFGSGSIRFASKAAVDLTQSFGGGFDNKISSAAIPPKWAVKLYKNSDKSQPSKLIQSTSTSYVTVANFANETYDDGTPLDNNVSAIEVFDPTCSGIAQIQTQDSPFISVASAQNSCQNLPTPTPGSPPPISNPPPSDGISLTYVSSHTVRLGDYFDPKVTFKVDSGSINAGNSFLDAVPHDNSNIFGAHPIQGFNHSVSAGQEYTFDQTTTTQFRMQAPNQTGTYRSVWQIWNGSRHIGPQAVILINVQDNPNPPPVGWSEDFWTNINLSGGVSTHIYEDTTYLFRDWGVNAPNGSVGADNWSAQYVRTYNFPGGEYRFHCQHDDGCRLFIDGQEKIGAWWDSSFTGHDWTGNLSAGNHEVKVHYYEKTSYSRLEAWWQGPGFLPRDQTCVPNKWCGEYLGNRNLMGTSAVRLAEDDNLFLDRGWGFGSPFSGFPENNFSARFTRTADFGCGVYRFHVIADDGVRLYIDGINKLDEWHDESADFFDVDVPMTDGSHQLMVDYFENQGDTGLRVSWYQLSSCATPTPASTPIPPTNTPTPTPSQPEMVELLSAPWDIQAPHSDVVKQQFNTDDMLVGKTTMRITYNLHGLTALGGVDSALAFTQDNAEKRISLADYGTNGLDGWQTVDIPLSDFGIDTTRPLNDGEMWTHWWYSGPYHVEITSIKVFSGSGSGPTATPTPTPLPPPTSTPTPLAPTATPSQGNMVELLSAPWDIQAPHSDVVKQQFNTDDMLVGKTTMRITYNLHGLTALGGVDSALSFTQDWEEKRISLADYGTNGLDGWQTIDIPISDFEIDTSRPLSDGEMWTHWWYSGPYHVEITSIKVF